MPFVLGISGKAKHGKGTASKAIKASLEGMGYSVENISFSDIIRSECASLVVEEHPYVSYEDAILWMTDQKLKDAHNDILGCTPRSIMQDYGNKMRQEHGVNYFIRKAFENMPDVDIVINDSVRFDNEIDAILNNSELGLVISVFNPYTRIVESNDLTENGISDGYEKSKISYQITNLHVPEDTDCRVDGIDESMNDDDAIMEGVAVVSGMVNSQINSSVEMAI